ncbi:hypothetical protein [Embleya hyalina]|uniref:Minor tail protein n=1 Tax=Embleya hyalina TaxID=516124 RepID=A0A401YHJ9_9ACTN|nr:hypothetical protein [Embleya hyalina]GCD94081.1 hypothetical protein EHYA_01737 [Embleya hyalina]
MTAAYRVLFTDLRSDQVLDAIPVDGMSFDDYIGKSGSLRASIPVTSAEMARRVQLLVPARTAVWVYRGGQVWWGGIVWQATPTVGDRGAAAYSIQAATWDSYLDRRVLMTTYETPPGGVDQLDIARELVAYTAEQPGGDIGITIDYGQVSGIVRDRTYSRYDQPRIRQLLDQLAAVQGGFEWRISSELDEFGARVKRLVLGYPRITAGSTDVVLDYPGPIRVYSDPEDGGGRATHWQSRGATTNRNQAADSNPMLTDVQEVAGAIDAGWPRLDGTSDHTTVEDPATLLGHAQADLGRAWTQTTIPEITITPGDRLSPAMLGATVRVRRRDLWHPAGDDRRYRVVGMSVTPPTRSSGETARLFLEAA